MNVQPNIDRGPPLISPEERARREEAVSFARGSVRFEGFQLDERAEAINRRFINGELSVAEHVAAIAAL